MRLIMIEILILLQNRNILSIMKYGRNQINKAGEEMMTSKDPIIVKSAIEKINDWRSLHTIVLELLQNRVNTLLSTNSIPIVLSSHRLKRLASIQYKLDVNPTMRLGGMQDIGGLRIVVENINTLNALNVLLHKSTFDGFKFEKYYNYVEAPKNSGYRSIHFIYKFVSIDNNYDGLRVELQIRTKLQHSWAMAVETAELTTQTRLKSSQGADEWLNYFKVIASLFAIKEETPILSMHQDNNNNMYDLMKIFYEMDSHYHLSEKLKALRITTKHAIDEENNDGYYILNINFQKQTVTVSSYSIDKEEQANDHYTRLERASKEDLNAVVLVSVPRMRELQEAYPSYFLDTKDFLTALDTMKENCKK